MPTIEEIAASQERLSTERSQATRAGILTQAQEPAQRLRSGRVVGVLGAVAATSVAALVILTPTGAAGDWNATPRAVALGLDSKLVQRCQADIVELDSSRGQSLMPVVAESRATSRAVLLQRDGVQGVCITTPSTRTGGIVAATPLQVDEILAVVGDGGSSEEDGIRYLHGYVSPQVDSVELVTSGSLHVTASVANGAFLAWWPGGDAIVTVTTKDKHGDTLTVSHP